MTYASYEFVDKELVSSIISFGDASTPVWRQREWNIGEYQEFVRKNGCGHCCTAMALNLHQIKITPHDEFALCRKLWGEPKTTLEFPQGNYQTVCGITKILQYHGVPAEYFGVPSREAAARHIENALKQQKQVIFWCIPAEQFPDTPFSQGEHYVMAVGYTEDGQILVANTSMKKAPQGVNLVDIDTISKALYQGSTPTDRTWGQRGLHAHCAGYVIVG